jgi:hypothetical protein
MHIEIRKLKSGIVYDKTAQSYTIHWNNRTKWENNKKVNIILEYCAATEICVSAVC